MTAADSSPLSVLVELGSTDAVVGLLDELKSSFSAGEWRPNNSNYRNIARKVGLSQTLRRSLLSTYIAASIPLHLMDGWTFLSRAFEALAHGDHHGAIHLGYYAELRACFSILASSGIGLFNERHIAVDANGEPQPWPSDPAVIEDKNNVQGTHIAAWKLLRAWGDKVENGSRLLQVIRVGGTNLVTWLDEVASELARDGHSVTFFSEAYKNALAKDWLEAWSIDLSEPDHDRSIRNAVSYNPSRILGSQPGRLDASSELIGPLRVHWSALEPSGWQAEAANDPALLILGLRKLRTYGEGKKSTADWTAYTTALESIGGKASSERLLQSEVAFEPLFRGAEETATQSRPIPVLSRSTLLLRLASALTGDVLTRASISKRDIEFWWAPFGHDLGFWDDRPDDTMFSGLWDSVRESLREIDEEIGDIEKASFEIASSAVGGHLSATQFSRAPLWLLGVEG